MRIPSSLLVAALLSAGCSGDADTSGSVGAAAAGSTEASAPRQDARTGSNSTTAGAFVRRTRELLNPDAAAMVFLYYDLAGLTPPIEMWVEEDGRVKYAPGLEKASRRAALKAELQAGAAAVRDVGALRISMNANLSEYDPTYEEFAVRALAPSSVVTYDAFGQKVELRFGNGRHAQIWRVPAAQAQLIRDKIGYVHGVSLDVLLRITDVQPGSGGGTLTTEVLEYELQQSQSGMTLARVQVGRN